MSGDGKTHFVASLEGLRGLAALSIAIYHSISIFTPEPEWSVATLFLKGVTAEGPIYLFFVLSGYVLALSLQRSLAEPSWQVVASYFIRRLARIVPMVYATVLVTWLLYHGVTEPDYTGLSEFARQTIRPLTNVNQLAKDLMLVSGPIVPVTWTIRIELFWSALLPAIVALHIWSPAWVRLVLFGLLLALCFIIQPGYSLRYGVMFYLGVLITTAPRPLFPGAVAALGAFILLFFPTQWGAGSALLVLGIVHSAKASAVLSIAPIRRLGRISYSFYLLHFQVLFFVVLFMKAWHPELQGVQATLVLTVTSICLTLGLADLTYEYIERPGMRFGRFLSDRIRPKTALQPVSLS